MMIITLISIIIINSVSVLCFAITSFGNGILYQLGWHICSIINSSICDGSLDTVIIHVTLAHFFTFPMQLIILRKYINWPLALLLTLSQQAGLWLGLNILFTYHNNIWLYRSLALLFCITAVDMILKELMLIRDDNNNINKQSIMNSSDSDDSPISQIKIELMTTNTIYGGDDIVELGIGSNSKSSHSNSNNSKSSIIKNKTTNNNNNSNDNNTIIDNINTDSDHKFYMIDTYSKFFITVGAGVTSGISSGIFSVGGPSLMWFISYNNLDSMECRATLAVCFWFENIGRMIFIFFFQHTVNMVNENVLVLFIVLTFSSITSLLLGNYIARFVDQTTFRRILIFLLSSGSVLMAINGLNALQTLIVCGLSIMFLCIIFTTSYLIATKQNDCINRIFCLDTKNDLDKSLDQYLSSNSFDDDDKEMNTLFGNKRTSARIGSPIKKKSKKSTTIFGYSVLTTEDENNDDDEHSDNVLF